MRLTSAAAWEYVAHTGSRFDPDILCRFFRAYQDVQPLLVPIAVDGAAHRIDVLMGEQMSAIAE